MVAVLPPVLAFHHLDADLDDYTNFPPARFADLVTALADAGYAMTTAATALAAVRDRSPAVTSMVVMTFDDGYSSVFPVVTRAHELHGLCGTIFPVANYLGRPNAWNRKCDYWREHLPAHQLVHLSQCGFEIGNHTLRHFSLPKLPEPMVDYEIAEGGRRLHLECGITPGVFAYPFGKHDERTRAMVSSHYPAAFTTSTKAGGRELGRWALALSRIVVTADMSPANVMSRVSELSRRSKA